MAEDDKRYDMLDDRDRKEAIRLQKIRQGLLPDTLYEEHQQQKQAEQAKTVTLAEKAGNFWYHYKWTVLVVGALVLIASFLFYQVLTNKKYDVTLVFCTYSYYEDSAPKSLSDAFEKVMSDADGDGEVRVAVFNAHYQKPDEQTGTVRYEMAAQSRVMAELADGENCIFIGDPELLESLAQKGAFADLRSVLGLEQEEPVYTVSLSQTGLFDAPAFAQRGKQYEIALRVQKEGTDTTRYEAQREALVRLFT